MTNRATKSRAATGFLHDGVPYLRVGHGPPLVMVQGISPDHEVPTGWGRRTALATALPFAGHFTVLVVNRKHGLGPGESMSDIAGHLAAAIEHDVGEPVLLQGTSTGGSVALQLAVDRPDLVRALVVVAAAYRLGPRGRALQAEMARLVRAGDPAGAWGEIVADMLPVPVRRPLRPVSRLLGRAMAGRDPADLLVTLDAEDAFDVGADLGRVTAPTLVVGGGKDPFYSRELFAETASGVRDGRLHLFERWGHGRTSVAPATAHLSLGFLLAATPARSGP